MKDQNADTQIQLTTVHRVGMISNQHTPQVLAPTERPATMKQQHSPTRWEVSLPTATKEDENAQRQASEVLVLQTQKIQELEARIEQQQLANSATNTVPGRIPASISTGSSNGSSAGSTTSNVTKEEMMQMFAQFSQNNKQGEGNTGTAKEKKKNRFDGEYIRNDLGNGERSKRRYPDSTNYCPSCGYDIKPTHTPGTCTNRKACHNEAATLTNKMGGVTTNCHFVT